ncbi:hypothetical protein K4L06_09285 [Lysobacter sp. BMK333-48F3]|uniref:hypothetical protein n=1 Tax=Lysobacter sp. BMK333-48F3 TaxID=2867962 RepID=UPI001C8B34F1|nr:hypothetical protein [Lysobacter sp. BMK333-48F3]MBX9401505.1 hypothetical protein [Lysobacter sp. BMK333-48F3]
MSRPYAALLCILLGANPVASAQPAECTKLNSTSQMARARGAVLIKHGDERYLLHLAKECSDVASARHLRVVTGGDEHLMCPQGSEVASPSRRCAVTSVEKVDAAEFEKARLHRY